ncbi:pilus assembly protein [Actinotalea sp.]|uniref:pilus assembly protein n=1 Tax=Actinotalea sp. TaxID=1872145 RepID=UPI003566A1FF
MSTARRGAPRARRRPTVVAVRRALVGSGDGRAPQGDEGSAVVEFLAVTLILLVPLVYLVLTLGRLQAAAFAVDGAAREAVRAVTSAAGASSDAAPSDRAPAGARAVAAVGIALGDQGIRTDPAGVLELSCGTDCSTPGSTVTATIRLAVDLPLVPGFLRDAVPLSVPVSASASGTLARFAEGRP